MVQAQHSRITPESNQERQSHSAPVKPKLLDQVRQAIRARHYSKRTEKTYADWIKRFVLFHGKRHPLEMGETEINHFLTDLAVNKKVTASTQNQALSAILFLYQHVLKKELKWIDPAVRAKKPKHLPVVLTKEEVRAIIDRMERAPKLVAILLYGAGLRLDECLKLRFKDIDFAKNQILVRDGKGQRDRITTLPASVKESLLAHLRNAYSWLPVTESYAVAFPSYCRGNKKLIAPASRKRLRGWRGAFGFWRVARGGTHERQL